MTIINSFMGFRRWYLKASWQFTLKKGRKSDKYRQTLNLCQILENHLIKFKFSGYVFLNRYFYINCFGYNSEMVWWKPLVDLTWNDPHGCGHFPNTPRGFPPGWDPLISVAESDIDDPPQNFKFNIDQQK